MPIHTEPINKPSHAPSPKEQLLSLAASEGDQALRRRHARLSSTPPDAPSTTINLRPKQRTLSSSAADSSLSSSLMRSSSPPSSPISSFAPKPRSLSSSSSSSSASIFRPASDSIFFSPPDPTLDISRLRPQRSRSQHALYPGASFSGTQKSGRNSYNVTVTIVDVDMDASSLCGYLRIHGLTDDYPELTTYFDAEIIGERYGFLTQNWGASEAEDLTHWGRFPAFRHVRHDLKRPGLTIKEREREKRGVVFMRWKERFLVPDHKVKNINGASFAGFYYVCVDFNPSTHSPSQQHQRSASQPLINPYAINTPAVTSKPQPLKLNALTESGDLPYAGQNRASEGTATMTGFYFHQNSEPYQQLSLCHVPDQTTGTYEFR